MRVLYHPDFPKDIRKFEAEYRRISEGLAPRFRQEIDVSLDAIKASPEGAGHFLHTGSQVVREFPFFVLYGVTGESLIFGSVVPSRSDPLTWLARFGGATQ